VRAPFDSICCGTIDKGYGLIQLKLELFLPVWTGAGRWRIGAGRVKRQQYVATPCFVA
jgi:hypothetical protein